MSNPVESGEINSPQISNGALQLNSRVMFTQVADEYVLLHLDKGEYFSLNAMGVTMFDLLKEGRKFSDIETEILALYDVDHGTVGKDLKELIEDLKSNQILIAVGGQ
ncbi:MAG: hypothetical protein ACI8P9_002165 [Parasphingorhabdus sp.]|jgi:hypothetical protein